MMKPWILTLFATLSLAKIGTDFIIVGDYGWIEDMTLPQRNFEAINTLVANPLSERDEIDFLMTVGDNVYQWDHNPDPSVYDIMMTVFNKSHIKELPIYAVRGNHDCVVSDLYAQVNLTKKYPNWKMPHLFYE